MEYHSKPPDQLKQELKEKEKPTRKIRLGSIILMVDLFIIVLISLFVFQKKSKDLDFFGDEKRIVRASTDEKKFIWRGYEIISKVNMKTNSALIEIKGKAAEANNSNGLIHYMRLHIPDNDSEHDFYTGPMKEVSLNKKFLFNLPGTEKNVTIYMSFFDFQKNNLFRYRIYP